MVELAAHQTYGNEVNVAETMQEMGKVAQQAARILATATSEQKDKALLQAAKAIREHEEVILKANLKDLEAGQEKKLSASFIDRLELNTQRLKNIAKGLEDIAKLDDPVGTFLAEWERPNGLQIKRIRTPLGVIGVIFESRPNVTADAGALCLKAGNAVILRSGSDSYHSSRAIHDCLIAGLKTAGLPEGAIQIVPTTDRAAVGEMLTGLSGAIDVIVPRGGKSLVERVQNEARVPVFAHLEGICHIYVDGEADLQKAIDIVVNSKLRRTGICGAAETLLIDKAREDFVEPICKALADKGCEIRADERVSRLLSFASRADEEDWKTEYLEAILSVALVDGISGAIDHINRYSSNHTDAIISENEVTAQQFFNEVDSAILLHNASTQFADGGEFGMGAEIGIATGKMHARGPVGVEQLTSFKYCVSGNGQTRA